MAFRYLFLPLFLLAFSCFGAKLPEIAPSDVSAMLKQIMQAHVSVKELNPPLLKRAFKAYIDDVDPLKCYLLEAEVAPWLAPEAEKLNSYLSLIEKGDYSPFEELHACMIGAIQRRERLEKEIDHLPLPTQVKFKDFQNISFAKEEEALKERLLRFKALQNKAVEKIELAARDKALQRVAKKRSLLEADISSSNEEERKRFILTHVIKAFASSFDTHTAYFTPNEAAQFLIQVQQRLFGIGAQLRDDLTGFTIVKVIDGSPASHFGLKANDRIIAINKEPIVGMEINDAVELIRGELGTEVTLTILRENEKSEETLDIDVTRGEVVIQESRLSSKILPHGEGVIAHISLFSFYQDPLHSSASDLYEEIAKLKREHRLHGIILDLRQNAGGVLPQAVAVTGLFIRKGIVVSIKDNQGRVESLRNIEEKTAWDGPLLVLTSKASASAAEIVSQTLQDYGRALIVGDEHTFGKGTFQTFTLDAENGGKVNPKGEFKVTRGRYYTVSGKSPQLTGVKADIVVPGPFSEAEVGERYAECPLETDTIQENFEDDLSDIPSPHREEILWLYKYNLQPKLKSYTRHLAKLRANSELRLKEDKFYQSFLKELKKDEPEHLTLYLEADLQLREGINILKDLITLTQ